MRRLDEDFSSYDIVGVVGMRFDEEKQVMKKSRWCRNGEGPTVAKWLF